MSLRAESQPSDVKRNGLSTNVKPERQIVFGDKFGMVLSFFLFLFSTATYILISLKYFRIV